MQINKRNNLPIYWFILFLFLSNFLLPAQAACNYFDGFKDNENGTFSDPRNELIWKRCPEGSEWNSGICIGIPISTDWYDAMRAAKSSRFLNAQNWRLPTKSEFEMVVGLLKDCEKNGRAISTMFNFDNFDKFDRVVWSASSYLNSDNEEQALIFDLWKGHIGYNGTERYRTGNTGFIKYGVFLVRSGTAKTAGDIEFEMEYKKVASFEKAKMLEKSRQEAEQAAYESRVRAEKSKFQSILNSKNPQEMYLAAGIYDRNGYSNKANEIYEAIISRFSSSNWAVKASDQLSATKRLNDAESAANQRQYSQQRANEDASRKSRSDCAYRISKCEDSCGSGNGRFQCTQGCKSICNQF